MKTKLFPTGILCVVMAMTVSGQDSKPVGHFEAEGKKIETKFVRVIYNAEGSELEDGSDSVEQLVYEGKDPKGNDVKVHRFQIVTKNTGYDDLQKSQDQDYKLKSVENGAKFHIEVPIENGELQLDKAYVGNLAYNFGTRETRNQLVPQDVSDISFELYALDLPKFGKDSKPGDKGIIYGQGYIKFKLSSKAKNIASDQISDFIVAVDGTISITHVRGKERESRAVSIDPEIVKKNI